MRGVFDEEELEPARHSRDTELTLGLGALVAIGCGLVLLCGVFFAIGYGVGRGASSKSPLKTPQAATEQEPLQASGSIPKPSATVQVPVPPPPVTAESGEPSTPSAGPAADSKVDGQSDVRSVSISPVNAPPSTASSPQVRPAFPSAQVQPSQQFMVQIAAVSNAQDAEALVNALKKRNYPVISKREPADHYVHVRIGPFATRALADEWRMKLLNDGYNAQVQP